MTENEIIRKFAARVLQIYVDNGCMDIDGGDMDAIVEKCGLTEKSHVTDDDLKDDWVLEYGFEVGDQFDRWTDLAQKLMKEGSA